MNKGVSLLSVGVIILMGQAFTAEGQTRTLGTFTLGPLVTQGCPAGFTCNSFTVSCPGIATDETGVIADQKPSGQSEQRFM